MLAMRRHQLLLTNFLWVQLAACGGSQPIVEKLEVSGRKFDIPRSCLGPPERYVSLRRIPTDAILIDMVLPDATCPDQINPDAGHLIPTEKSPIAMVLVTPFGKGVRPLDARNSLFASLTLETSYPEPRNQVGLGHATSDQYRRFTKSGGLSNVRYEAWRSPSDSNSFIVCVQDYLDKELIPRVRRCDHYFVYQGLSFKVSYGRNWARNWHDVQTKIIHQFARFATDGEGQRRVSGNRPP
jgi:hypothetical protein